MENLDFKYDDTNLQKLFGELQPKQRIKAMRGAFRMAGNKVRKAVIDNLRESVNSNKTLEKGIKVMVWKKVAGFRVTVGNGKYKSRRYTGKNSKEVPVLRWLDTGTGVRKTKGSSRGFGLSKKGHSTGHLKRYGYMAKTKAQVASSVTGYIQESVIKSIKRTAKKYGCS